MAKNETVNAQTTTVTLRNAEAPAPAPPADDDDDRRSHTKDQRHSKSTKNMQRINLQIPQTHVQIPNMDNY